MTGPLEQLLDEFVDRWARNEPLVIDGFLVRAGPHADELAVLIDRFLERAPRREPTPDALAFVRSLDDPPLLRARQALGMKLDDLAATLVQNLGLDEKVRGKVRRYYQQLELGQLDPTGVAPSVWDALTSLFGRDARRLAHSRPTAMSATPMYREANFIVSTSVDELPLSSPATSAAEPDGVDRLFGVAAPD